MNTEERMHYSIVVEWKNALNTPISWSNKALINILIQMRKLNYAGELLIIGPNDFNGKIIKKMAQNCGKNLNIRFIQTKCKGQYQLMNEGLVHANGSVVIFIHSDVIIEDGCLKLLLDPFKNKGIKIVSGTVYVYASSIYEKTMALTWIFPLKSKNGPLCRAREFNPSIVAARKKVWRKYPFPADKTLGCGSLTELARPLITDGIIIWKQPLARASHPVPNGTRNFFLRAMADGLHNTFLWRDHANRPLSFIYLCSWFLKNALFRNLIIIRFHKKVKMQLFAIPVAFIIVIAYYGAGWLGGFFGLISRKLALRICAN